MRIYKKTQYIVEHGGGGRKMFLSEGAARNYMTKVAVARVVENIAPGEFKPDEAYELAGLIVDHWQDIRSAYAKNMIEARVGQS